MFWLVAFFFFPLFLFWYFTFSNGSGLSKFGRDLNQLFLKFLGQFFEVLVIVTSHFYILIREGIIFVQNLTPPPPPPFLSNVHVLRPPVPEKMVFTNVSVCLSGLCVDFKFVSTITFKRIDRLDWNLVNFFSAKKWRSSSLASHFWPMVLVLSIKDGFYKIEKSIFRLNYAKYKKMLRSKIIHLKETYKFCFYHFLEKRTDFILIKKTLKIKSCAFRPNNARYEKMLTSKIVHLKKIYNFNFDHFLIKRTVFVLIVKNVIKNQKFHFPDKLCDIRNKC